MPRSVARSTLSRNARFGAPARTSAACSIRGPAPAARCVTVRANTSPPSPPIAARPCAISCGLPGASATVPSSPMSRKYCSISVPDACDLPSVRAARCVAIDPRPNSGNPRLMFCNPRTAAPPAAPASGPSAPRLAPIAVVTGLTSDRRDRSPPSPPAKSGKDASAPPVAAPTKAFVPRPAPRVRSCAPPNGKVAVAPMPAISPLAYCSGAATWAAIFSSRARARASS